MAVLRQKFFDRPAQEVAEDLLGMTLVRVVGGKTLRSGITETEAYLGPEDAASHARHGQTLRNAPMFGPPGHWYIYLTYGMHWMLNIVTGPDLSPSAVLLRGVDAVYGPGRLTKQFKIDKRFNVKPATKDSGLWIEEIRQENIVIQKAPRIGIAYAGAWAAKPFRFTCKL